LQGEFYGTTAIVLGMAGFTSILVSKLNVKVVMRCTTPVRGVCVHFETWLKQKLPKFRPKIDKTRELRTLPLKRNERPWINNTSFAAENAAEIGASGKKHQSKSKRRKTICIGERKSLV
jgi:hypothetical protein